MRDPARCSSGSTKERAFRSKRFADPQRIIIYIPHEQQANNR